MKVKSILLSFLIFCIFITSSFLIMPNTVHAAVCDDVITYKYTYNTLSDIPMGNQGFQNQMKEFLKDVKFGEDILIYSSSTNSYRVYLDTDIYQVYNNYGSLLFYFKYSMSYSINEYGYNIKDASPGSSTMHFFSYNKYPDSLDGYKEYVSETDENGNSIKRQYRYCFKYIGSPLNSISILYHLAGIPDPDPTPDFNPIDYSCQYSYIYDNSNFHTNSLNDFKTFIKYAGGKTNGGGVGRYPISTAPKSPHADNSNSLAFGNINSNTIRKCYDKDTSTWQPAGEVTYDNTNDSVTINDNINYSPSGSDNIKDNIVNDELPIVLADNIILSSNALNLNIGSSKVLKAYVYPDNTTDKRVTWLSSNPSIATVNDGVIEGLKEGITYVTATTSNGLSTNVKVTVYPANTVSDGGNVNIDPDTGSSIWDFLKAIIDAIGGFITAIVDGFSNLGTSLLNGITSLFKPLLDGLNRIIDWLLNFVDNVIAALPGLLIPSADFMTNLKDIELPKLTDNFGFLYQPIQVINDSLTQLSNISTGDGVISYGPMNDPFYGVQIIPAGSLDLTSMLNSPGISNLYHIYKLFINASFLLMFINFSYKKLITLLGGN